MIIPLNYSHEASDGNGCKEGEVTSQTIHIAYWFTSHCLDKQQQEIKPFCPKIYSTVLLRSSLFLIGLSLVCLTMSMYIYMVLKRSVFIQDKQIFLSG